MKKINKSINTQNIKLPFHPCQKEDLAAHSHDHHIKERKSSNNQTIISLQQKSNFLGNWKDEEEKLI